jgi:predicted Zn-dependent protease
MKLRAKIDALLGGVSAAIRPRPAVGLAALSALVMLEGCAAIEPRFDAPFTAAAPLPPRKQETGARPSPEHARIIALFDGAYKFRPAERYLNEVLAKLADVSEPGSEPYKVTILNSPVVNAFAMAPNHLYVTRGLLALANDGAEVAAVMAHEIAHISARHALQREEEEKRAAVITQAASVVQSKVKSEEVEDLAKRSIASFSRQQELEADQIGIRVIAKAGYDPYGAARFLTALGRSAALKPSLFRQGPNTGKPDFLATHPSTPERIALATNAARQIGAPGLGTTERAAYLSAIDGMTFGDDPAEGAIRGRRYLHGRLGFTFLAPEDFTLEGSSKAILGVASDGAQALRLDSVRVPEEMTLTDYLASGWIDGLIKTSIASTEVNALPAATANARAGEWSFRIAVIRFTPTEVYRLIFAARDMNHAVEERFQASIQSFHRASKEEIESVRPLRLAIVTAKLGDRMSSLIAGMAVPERNDEVFLLLNGLEPGNRIEPGNRYKTIVQ